MGMDRHRLFPTPVFAFEVEGTEELNAELSQRLLVERSSTPGFQVSNVGGWHSVPDLSQRPAPCYRAVVQMIVEHVSGVVSMLADESGKRAPNYRYAATAWAMVMGDGDYTVIHDHGDVHWSSAYYVDAGDPPADPSSPSGRLAFIDPRGAGRPIPELEIFPSTFTILPRTGLLVVFPGFLQHYVHSYRGQRPRITISCNLTMEASRPRPSSAPPTG
jgi:uncharacterized protein (TIGR02466 family)